MHTYTPQTPQRALPQGGQTTHTQNASLHSLGNGVSCRNARGSSSGPRKKPVPHEPRVSRRARIECVRVPGRVGAGPSRARVLPLHRKNHQGTYLPTYLRCACYVLCFMFYVLCCMWDVGCWMLDV
jgi:hypothetical protein